MKNSRGFTLAEILITLSIIGIVAAIMIPSLLVNVNDKAFDAQRKALHARMAQAIGQLDDMNAYEASEPSKSAVRLITNGLNKVYKIATVCDQSNLGACDIPDSVKTMNGEPFKLVKSTSGSDTTSGSITFGDLDSHFSGSGPDGADDNQKISYVEVEPAGFRTTNGESLLVFYNPRCAGSSSAEGGSALAEVCINMIYDLNGASKTPNQVGKDIGFITVVGSSTPTVVAPKPYDSNLNGSINYYGSDSDADASGKCKAEGESLILPDREQLISLVVNQKLIGNLTSGTYWSGTIVEPGTGENATGASAWAISTSTGLQTAAAANTGNSVRCIKK